MERLKKILVICTIFCVIVGIWFYKNRLIQSDNRDKFKLDATYDFDIEKLKSEGLPIIVDFGSDSCIPCKQMAPVLEDLNEEYRGKAIVKFVDISKNGDTIKDFPIKVIPTQFFFNADGTPFKPKNVQQSNLIMYSSEENEEHAFTAHEGPLDKDGFKDILNEMGVN